MKEVLAVIANAFRPKDHFELLNAFRPVAFEAWYVRGSGNSRKRSLTVRTMILRGRALLILQSQTCPLRSDRQFLHEPRSWTQAFSCHASAQALPIPAADPAARCGEILLATPLRPGAPDHRQGAAAGRPLGGLKTTSTKRCSLRRHNFDVRARDTHASSQQTVH